MAETSEISPKISAPESRSNTPQSRYQDLIRGDKIVRTELKKTNDPQDPIAAINVKTGEREKMFSDEKAIAYTLFGIKTPPKPKKDTESTK